MCAVYTYHMLCFKLNSKDGTGAVDLMKTLNLLHDFFELLLRIDPKAEHISTALDRRKTISKQQYHRFTPCQSAAPKSTRQKEGKKSLTLVIGTKC